MKITLNHYTPLWVASEAIRECWQSQDKSDTEEVEACSCGECKPVVKCGPKDLALIDRIGNKFKHASTLEHLTYSFRIENISRAVLQELARHRMASLSVKSTRYTLKELKDEETFTKGLSLNDWISATSSNMEKVYKDKSFIRAEKYLVFTGEPYTDASSVQALENLRLLLVGRFSHQHGPIANDISKYCLPESYKTSLAWTINARSLQNFLALRTSKAALWEIRDLANAIFEALPEDHKYLFEEHINEN
jgi:thymidylate synthase (FAD)